MTDITTLIPTFSEDPGNKSLQLHLPTLENHGLSTADLLTLEPKLIAVKTRIPLLDVYKLIDAAVTGLQTDLKPQTGEELTKLQHFVSTGDDELDRMLGGGIMTGSLSEIVGER